MSDFDQEKVDLENELNPQPELDQEGISRRDILKLAGNFGILNLINSTLLFLLTPPNDVLAEDEDVGSIETEGWPKYKIEKVEHELYGSGPGKHERLNSIQPDIDAFSISNENDGSDAVYVSLDAFWGIGKDKNLPAINFISTESTGEILNLLGDDIPKTEGNIELIKTIYGLACNSIRQRVIDGNCSASTSSLIESPLVELLQLKLLADVKSGQAQTEVNLEDLPINLYGSLNTLRTCVQLERRLKYGPPEIHYVDDRRDLKVVALPEIFNNSESDSEHENAFNKLFAEVLKLDNDVDLISGLNLDEIERVKEHQIKGETIDPDFVFNRLMSVLGSSEVSAKLESWLTALKNDGRFPMEIDKYAVSLDETTRVELSQSKGNLDLEKSLLAYNFLNMLFFDGLEVIEKYESDEKTINTKEAFKFSMFALLFLDKPVNEAIDLTNTASVFAEMLINSLENSLEEIRKDEYYHQRAGRTWEGEGKDQINALYNQFWFKNQIFNLLPDTETRLSAFLQKYATTKRAEVLYLRPILGYRYGGNFGHIAQSEGVRLTGPLISFSTTDFLPGDIEYILDHEVVHSFEYPPKLTTEYLFWNSMRHSILGLELGFGNASEKHQDNSPWNGFYLTRDALDQIDGLLNRIGLINDDDQTNLHQAANTDPNSIIPSEILQKLSINGFALWKNINGKEIEEPSEIYREYQKLTEEDKSKINILLKAFTTEYYQQNVAHRLIKTKYAGISQDLESLKSILDQDQDVRTALAYQLLNDLYASPNSDFIKLFTSQSNMDKYNQLNNGQLTLEETIAFLFEMHSEIEGGSSLYVPNLQRLAFQLELFEVFYPQKEYYEELLVHSTEQIQKYQDQYWGLTPDEQEEFTAIMTRIYPGYEKSLENFRKYLLSISLEEGIG